MVGLASVAVLAAAGLSPPPSSVWVLLGSLIIAGVSSLDDIATVSPKVRLAVQGGAAMLTVAALGPAQSITLGPIGSFDLGALAWPLTVLWIVGMTNAFNFMDGVDGIAGLTAAIAMAVLSAGLLVAGENFTALVAAALSAAALGFLAWNWQPAKIFMGDVGSAFLGYTIAVLPLTATAESRAWLLPLTACVMWPFLFDTTYTIIRRLTKRENVFEAHRSHLYQRLVIRGWSHRAVASLYGGLSAVAGGAAFAAFCIPAIESDAMCLLLCAAIALGACGLVVLVRGVESRAAWRVAP